MPTSDSTRINVELPTGLHIKLKAAAALSQQTVKQAVTEAIEEWVKRHKS